MENIQTYAVGNGEITLTDFDAEELRIILQTKYIAYVINELIDSEPNLYKFNSEKQRYRFINEMVSRFTDLRDITGCYEEMLEEAMLERAEELGIRG